MRTFIFRRLFNLVPVLFGISLAAFFLMYVLPGDPIDILAGQSVDPQVREALRNRYHLNDPVPVQYLSFLGRAIRGDFGVSIRSEQPVIRILLHRFPPTLQLAVGSLLFAVVLGGIAGLLSAARPRSWVDAGCMLLALGGVSVPVFWLGILLMLLLGGGFFAVSGYQSLSLRYLTLPCIALGAVNAALIARLTRSSLLEVLRRDYIRTARAKGVAGWRILLRHALRNALIPIVTVLGTSLAGLLSGAVLTETVFGIPGLGTLIFESIRGRDYPVVVGAVMWLALTFVLVNLCVDLLYAVIDPRIRYDRSSA